MTALCKRFKKINETLQKNNVGSSVPVDALSALNLLKDTSTVKFAESVDVSFNLGVDVKKSDQVVRGAVLLPNGTGKEVRVAVFAQGAQADAAKTAGADIVGYEDLAEKIKAGKMDFDVLIAVPSAMPLVGKLGPILGPRGLMPNPKVGTVASDTAQAVKNAKKGQVQFKTDKGGIVHCRIGTVKFSAEELKQNLRALLLEVKRLKPSSSKGIYLKKATLSTTMGPGILVDLSSLEKL